MRGYRGHLVAASYLAKEFAATTIDVEARGWQHLRHALKHLESIGPAASPRQMLELLVAPLVETLGLGALHEVEPVGDVIAGSTRRHSSAESQQVFPYRPVAVIVTPWGDRLDRYWRAAVTEALRRRSDWCLACNGMSLRVVDARRLYLRRFAEFDLATTLIDRRTAAALWRLAGSSALFTDCEDKRSLHALVGRSDQHSGVVCRSLRDGVLTASEQILNALMSSASEAADEAMANSFEQALTIVYRIVFLLFAEARSLVPLWHPWYRGSYSVESLREAAERAGPPTGIWDTLRAIGRLAHAGCRAGDLRVTAFNGRLFAPGGAPLAERRGLDNEPARRAVVALTTRPAADRRGRERISYGELDVEQLGSVYETLLDFQPRAARRWVRPRRALVTVKLEPGSGVRKATGTFYTPRFIADYLVRRTLGPIVRGLAPDDILQVRVLDPAMGSGAFLVAACRYLSAAYEDALVAHARCHPGDIDEGERVSIRRVIAERCLYGVDLNPMAVQLARLSLWLTTLSGDRPLSFLDHRLVVGDSLVGAWLENLGRPPRPGRRQRAGTALPLFDNDPAADAIRAACPIRFSLEMTPSHTVEQVRAKERAYAALSARNSVVLRWKRVANLWCAAWFDDGVPPRVYEAVRDAALSRPSTLPPHTSSDYLARVDALTSRRRFLHWELEFPEVFFDSAGRPRHRPGFDAIIGNPPWDMLREDVHGNALDTRSSPASTVRFTRESGAYSAQSEGHANRYQLFTERALALTRSGGRFGLVLPGGLVADYGSASLRRALFSRSAVDAIVSLDNTRRIFPIHRSVRFLLLTATAGDRTQRVALRFGVAEPHELYHGEDVSDLPDAIRITSETLQQLSGSSLDIPDLRHPLDLVILEKAVSLFLPLGAKEGWDAHFGRELNATEDRAAFRADRLGLTIVDGRHLEPFRVALGRSSRSISIGDARRLLPGGHFDRPRLAYRDVASATNRTTLIAAILPARCVSTHTVFCLKTTRSLADQWLLCGLFNSLVVNYLARLRVSTHVTTAIVERLPIPARAAGPRACREIAALARRLSRRDNPETFAELNRQAAQLYQLTVDEFRHVLSTFPLVEKRVRDRALALFAESQRH